MDERSDELTIPDAQWEALERRFAPARRKLRLMAISALVMVLVLFLVVAALFFSLMEVPAVTQGLCMWRWRSDSPCGRWRG